MIKVVVVFLLLSFSSKETLAQYIYEHDFLRMGRSYLAAIGGLENDGLAAQPQSKKSQCAKRYSQILKDGKIDIRLLIGYFDWTTGSEVIKNGENFGLSPSIDPGAFAALKRIITGRCPGRAEFCEFNETAGNPYKFTKTVVIERKRYPVQVEIYFPSFTEYLSSNTRRYPNEQKSRSLGLYRQFHSALQSADVVFYFGHSRNGGGPDFNPPVFMRGKNKLDYNGYYIPNRPGYKYMLSSLRDGGGAPAILGLMSCDSRNHFLSGVRKAAPQTGVISSLNVLKVDVVYTAMIGGLDAILRGQCQKGFVSSIGHTSLNRQNIAMDGVF